MVVAVDKEKCCEDKWCLFYRSNIRSFVRGISSTIRISYWGGSISGNTRSKLCFELLKSKQINLKQGVYMYKKSLMDTIKGNDRSAYLWLLDVL